MVCDDKAIDKDDKLVGITEISVDVLLLYIKTGSSLRRHEAVNINNVVNGNVRIGLA